jgi:hypothetical protein
MPEPKLSEALNPRHALKRRENDAEGGPTAPPAAPTPNGPKPPVEFFKARDRGKDKEGLEKALKKRGY